MSFSATYILIIDKDEYPHELSSWRIFFCPWIGFALSGVWL